MINKEDIDKMLSIVNEAVKEDRITEIIFSVEHMAYTNFIERLMDNPSYYILEFKTDNESIKFKIRLK